MAQSLIARMLFWLCALGAALPAAAAYPDRPIRIVVPLPAGTAPDIFARFLGQKLTASLKQPVIIENRPGANTVIGTGVVAKATPDGYTLLYATVQHVMLKPLLGTLPFDPATDFVPVTTTSATGMVLIVPASSRFHSAADIVAAQKAKPGEINFATPGIGSPAHLAVQAFLSSTGTSARHIPMKGSTESVTATAGAQVDYTITSITNALPLIQSGKLKPLGSASAQRAERLPAVPTMREAAPPGFIYETWGALFAPAQTPRPVLELLNRELVRVLNEADTREFWGTQRQPAASTLAPSLGRIRAGRSAAGHRAGQGDRRDGAMMAPAAQDDTYTAATAARLVAAFDASGVHRASTPGDSASGSWLCDEAARSGAAVSRVAVPLDRTVVDEAFLQCAGVRLDGLPMFDTPPTVAGGARGRLVPCGEAGEIGYLELPSNSASIKGQRLELIRRETRHAALVVATRVTGESLAPINAQFFAAPFGPPVLQVAGMHAAFLAAQAQAHAAIEVVACHHRVTAQSYNVAAHCAAPTSDAPIVLLTPRTSWWESTAERAGGIVAWLAGLTAAGALARSAQLQREVRAYATCGHELGHVGLEHLFASEPQLIASAACWLHLGANLGTASNVAMTVRTDDTDAAEAMRALLVAEGYPAEAIRLEPASTFSGEGRDVAAHGGRVLSLAGANAHFHAASDRWPANVSATNVAAIARAVAKWVEQQAG